ncbi:hypothetical protein [Streptomyces sp. SBT349]|uniref:hypothetical protein n=1 Tax=Streptomyces sp. SBT349 TaxID=1580539 RepID=UPI00066E99BB|nr:hypothetical protein [Streptomyces sp. SBT349]
MTSSQHTAEYLLIQALAREGITGTPDSTASNPYVRIDVGDGAAIWVSGTGWHENETEYPPTEHDGWLACHYPDPENDTGDFTVIHNGSGTTDFAVDTAAVVAAIRPYLPAADH